MIYIHNMVYCNCNDVLRLHRIVVVIIHIFTYILLLTVILEAGWSSQSEVSGWKDLKEE